MIETDADRAIFFNPADWGCTATFAFTDGTGRTLAAVPGLYEDPAVTKGLRQNNQFSYSQGQDTTGDKPEFRCRASDVADVRNGKATVAVTHDGITEQFTVYNKKGDGTGMACIRLMRA